MGPEDLRMSSIDFEYKYQALAGVPVKHLFIRFAVLQLFNRYLSLVLPLVDLGNKREHSIGAKLRALSNCIFKDPVTPCSNGPSRRQDVVRAILILSSSLLTILRPWRIVTKAELLKP